MNMLRPYGLTLSEMRQFVDNALPSPLVERTDKYLQNAQAPVYGRGGKERKRGILNRERIVNRVYGDSFGNGNNPVKSAIKQYFTNPEGAPTARISKLQAIRDKYNLDNISLEDAWNIWENIPDGQDKIDFYSAMYLDTVKQHEDAKRIYYGEKPIYGTMEPAQYQPTIGKGNNVYQVNNLLTDSEFDNFVLPTWADWRGTHNTERTDKRKGNVGQVFDAPYLHDSAISEGFDDRGQYLSLYDLWDYNTRYAGKSGDKVISTLTGGKPFDVYNRYYLDEWLDIPEGERGNPYIAPAYIEAERSYKEGGPKKKETAYARKYREEWEEKLKKEAEHPTLKNAFRNDTTDAGEQYYDIVNARYNSAMEALRRKGFEYNDAMRLAPMMVAQNVLEGGWRLSRPDNNFGGMQVNGKFLTFDSPDAFYDAYIDMLDQKWGSSVARNNWRNAQNLDDWARILNHEELNLWSKERYDAYNREHSDNPVYLYAPEWENNSKSYRTHLAGVEPRVNTYLDMVLNENPYTEEMYNAPIEPTAQLNDGFNLSMDQFQKLLESNREDFAKGGHKIHIKKENRGKFTALKKRTGHSASWFKAHGTPAQKKMATFALNAKKWKHEHGGIKF